MEAHMSEIVEHGDRKTPEVAFVLSGGAALGASQVGMLRALLERGITPDLIVGTSIGAWNGLWLAAHPDLKSLDKLERVWKSITIFELFGGNVISFVTNRATKRPYLVTNEGMMRIYQRATEIGDLVDATFEQLPIPLKVTASNLTRGETAIFDHGPVAPAVLASSAIPGLFPPLVIDGEQYVDGGLLDNGGVSVAVEAGAKQIYVLSVMTAGTQAEPVATLTDLIVRGLHLVAANHVHSAIRHYANRADFIVIEDNTAERSSALDFRHPTEFFATGYLAAQRALEAHDRLLAERAQALAAAQVLVAAQAQAAAQSRTQLATIKKDAFLAQWLQQPAAQAALNAVAWMDVTLQRSWKQINELVANLPHHNGPAA
jgi:NTE family protein